MHMYIMELHISHTRKEALYEEGAFSVRMTQYGSKVSPYIIYKRVEIHELLN